MRLKTMIFLLVISFFANPILKADDGMWIPLLLKKYNIKDMQAKGFKLTAEDIYSINKASMKDAVVIFGRGCTGELVSDEGLILTNHHCGYGAIQKHSSLSHDYLTDGFWAMNKKQELPNEGLTVRFLERMEDVSAQVLKGITDDMSESERSKLINKQAKMLENKTSENGKYQTIVKPLFNGNQYFLYVYKVYKDVRLVGAPPSGIGKFGGDTDNWMWPRHTGDFSVFRVYANKNNEPAEYSPDNVPYKPKKFFPISMQGVKKGDFTMVFGYPGTTQEYLPSFAVKMLMETQNPHRIKIRQNKIDIMSRYMEKDPEIRIKYASKYAGISNYWKKWIGENRGLKRLNAIAKKQEFEKKISKWISKKKERKEKFGHILEEYGKIYNNMTNIQLADEYFYEAIYRSDIIRFAGKCSKKSSELQNKAKSDKTISELKNYAKGFYKDFDYNVDKEVFTAMIALYYQNVDKQFFPAILSHIDTEFKGNVQNFVDAIYSKSILPHKEKFDASLNDSTKNLHEIINKDPLVLLYSEFVQVYWSKIAPELEKSELKLKTLHRLWMRAIMKFKKDEVLYPDANFTLRIAYGKVDDYYPRDGVKYLYYTTLDGIIEKDNPDIYDYRVPAKLKQLHADKDYGKYGENGEMHVCFTASNHTTGGNSGSPVVNGKGQLIGINFDRNWEGTMSDIMYDPDMCRNITVDIRYVLFIIDKFAGAKHLIKEMDLVW